MVKRSKGKWEGWLTPEIEKLDVGGNFANGMHITPEGCRFMAKKLRRLSRELDKVTTEGNKEG